ncbi:unnamed protein product [Durusdinium trenchii]|uniref:Integrase catalytic domain-containing protein n=1 Tax=Durusdinium trenchii TaxID=1381693 RepID=A0ABP0S470_9DINO
MAEDDKGSSAWYKVPTWDGNPTGFRQFKKEMEWWIASLDPISCGKFNVAARWTLRQTGIVRARCEEFLPSELEGSKEVTAKDPDTGDDIVVEEANPWKGLRKLVDALEESMGKTTLDRKGDLRRQFYVELRRSPGERISAFCSRFRRITSELKREGINLPADELGWFLRNKLGLDTLRVQLLDTALRGRESYEEVEGECLRLFRDLHSEDPLHRQKATERAPLLNRFLNQSQAPPRSALVTEGPVEEIAEGEEDEEELVPDHPDQIGPALEEVLTAEAEVLAAEIQALEEEGLEPDVLEALESGARRKIAEIKKDRGYGKQGSSSMPNKPKFTGNQVNGKKAKSSCWDCGQQGHWSGDHGCPNPGAGLFKPKSNSAKPQKHVRVAEALTTEMAVDADVDDTPAHEVMTTSRVSRPSTLAEALQGSHEVHVGQLASLSLDKRLMGALDSACNRTCCGSAWVEHYLAALQSAPEAIQQLVSRSQEQETFKFGDGGTQKSSVRIRLPMVVGTDLVLTWVSIIPVGSLGLLLGRDWLDGVGCVLSFSKRVMRADHLSGHHIPLKQLAAGHFALRLIPSEWPIPGKMRWRRVGQDGVVALQISHSDWLQRKLLAVQSLSTNSHEHLLSEHSVCAAKLVGVSFDDGSCFDDLAHSMAQTPTATPTSTTSTSSSPNRAAALGIHGRGTRRPLRLPVEENHHPSPCKTPMARARHLLMVMSAALASIHAISIPFHQQHHAVAASSPADGFQRSHAYTAGNLKEAMWLRDRLGWQTSFVEDPMLQGMLAARSSKGVANKIRQEAVAEAKALAIKAKEEGKELQAVRELIGPKGGLPALKTDLQKLASLLHVSFNEKTTVEQLKAGIKPVVQALMAKAPASSMTSSSSGASFQEEPPKPSKAPSLGELCQDLHRRRLRLQSGGTMRYDMTAKDSEMDGHMTHGWTQQEIAAAQEGGFMTPEEMRRLNWEVQGDLRIATSSSCIADELHGMVCSRDHAHQPVIGGSKITSRAGHYPVALAKAIVRGLEKQFHVDHGRCREVLAVVGAEEERSDDGGDSVMDPFNSESEISSMDDEGSPETKIPSAIRLAVKRLHENTGHRSNRRLARALVLSGAPKEVVLAAKSLKCSICDEKKRPKSRRPTSLPTPKDVSDQVHLDIFESVDVSEQRFYIVHCIDWTSRFQMAEVLETKDSDSIVNWFQERWMSIFGPPRVIVADQGREFVSWVFQEMCDRHSILLHHIPVQAPWCNGVCERGGGILKGLLECCVKSRSVAGLADMKVALQECVLAYNADINELGVSPAQAAIGRQPRMIGDVLGNFGQRLAEHGLIDGRPSLARQVALRETARIAMTQSSGAAPGTPVPALITGASQVPGTPPLSSRMEESVEAARELEAMGRKRAAELEAETLREGSGFEAHVATTVLKSILKTKNDLVSQYAKAHKNDSPVEPQSPHYVDTLEADIRDGLMHPLKAIQQQVDRDKQSPELVEVQDHGSWSGQWPLPSRSSWMAHETCCVLWPSGGHEVNAAKTARREVKWRNIPLHERDAYRQAAETGWKVQTDNGAFEILTDAEAQKVRARLKAAGQMNKILTPRYIYTDKNDGLRRWYLRLNKSLTRLGWVRSSMDAAQWFLKSPEGTLDGIVVSHVDDLLMAGTAKAHATLKALGEELGFGSLETGSFTYCGKLVQQLPDKSIEVSMRAYHENMQPVSVPIHRKKQLDAQLTPSEHRQLRAILGSLQWVVAQVRWDMGYQLSVLQGEPPVVKTLLRANALVRLMKQDAGFKLKFGPMCLDGAGILVVSDASLGNVTRSGGADGSIFTKVFSQAAYLVLVGDRDLMEGREGKFGVLDSRSHRLSRVCRSTFGAELLGSEEAFDAGLFCRGLFAEAQGFDVLRGDSCYAGSVPLGLVSDAKDVFDKSVSDTPTYGSQKSLAFSVAWIREVLRKDCTRIHWTSTENMLIDCGTKEMNATHLKTVLDRGSWSITYNPSYVKQTLKPTKPLLAKARNSVLPGRVLNGDDPILSHLQKLAERPGWHVQHPYGIHVCRNAVSFRTPNPRFSKEQYPLRTSYGRFDNELQAEWRILEDKVRDGKLEKIGDTASVLVTFFGPESQNPKDQQKKGSAEKEHLPLG